MVTIGILTYRMMQGFGVDVVIAQFAKFATAFGHSIVIGCIEKDHTYSELDIHLISPDLRSVDKFCLENKLDIVIAHTTPFFEVLPKLRHVKKRIAWEHGDPTPEFFDLDQEERKRIKKNKIEHVYPHVDDVIAISEFIRSDIQWPSAKVITNGSDHVRSYNCKSKDELFCNEKLKIGTMMRLGAGESKYKGNALFLDLVKQIRNAGFSIDAYVLGRGTEQDAIAFKRVGIMPILNAPHVEKVAYLRELDVFVSSSLWEGFNLPLVEAMRVGTVSLAYDTGAHPEVTPLLFRCVDDLVVQIKEYISNKDLLLEHSIMCQKFTTHRHNWLSSWKTFENFFIDEFK